MKNKNTILKIEFNTEDWLNANRKACREIDIESGIVPKTKVHKNKKKYDRKRDKKIKIKDVNSI